MTILTFPPEIGLRSLQLELVANSAVFTSPLTRATQAQELAGARWMVDAELATMNAYQLRIWRAFRAQLRGAAGLFYFRLPTRISGSSARSLNSPAPVPLYTADVLVPTTDSTMYSVDMDGGFSGGFGSPVYAPGMSPPAFPTNTLPTSGWTSGRGPFIGLMPGDYFSVNLASGGRAMCMVTEPVAVADDGTASITFEPPLRSAPAASAPINYLSPSTVYRLIDDKQGATRMFPGIYGDSAVSFQEVLT